MPGIGAFLDQAAGLTAERSSLRRHPPQHGAPATTTGKARNQRITPPTKQTPAVLPVWLAERAAGCASGED
jgi:hypothetical protein